MAHVMRHEDKSRLQGTSNPINPILRILLLWLRESEARALLTEPTQRLGWYSYVDWDGRQYLLGARASDDDVSGSGSADRKQRSIRKRYWARSDGATTSVQVFQGFWRRSRRSSGVV